MKASSTIQPQLDMFSGPQLAEAGLSLAVETADKKVKEWSKTCWQLFLVWLRRKPKGYEFMIEEFRAYLYEYDLLERPPSETAFGFISKRGVKEKWIEHAGLSRTKNKISHSRPANVWRKL